VAREKRPRTVIRVIEGMKIKFHIGRGGFGDGYATSSKRVLYPLNGSIKILIGCGLEGNLNSLEFQTLAKK